jgi:hypothetical protein
VLQIFCGFVVFFFALLHLYNLATNRWIFIKSLSAFFHLALTVMHHAHMLSSSHASFAFAARWPQPRPVSLLPVSLL